MYIVKIGGGGGINVEGIVKDLSVLDEPALVVHGANSLRDELAERLGTPKTMLTSVSGYASVFSDEKALDVIMMSYAGLKNKRIVELCQSNGINAVGLTGIDGGMVRGQRNRGIRVKEGDKTLMKRDFSGKPKSVNGDLIRLLMDNGYTPVLTIPILDENGIAINSENDDIINVLQDELKAKCIFQFIEAAGFLDNKDDPDSRVVQMSRSELEQREAQVEGRMKRKMLALKHLFKAGAGKVIIADGRIENPIESALAGNGTVIQ
ncbi:MAG: [LysW]-aminoadipate kinase [Woeseiaceae bacterium]|nr:[LysW]-aminoadipate kinase [Woeseiaceae bacterium]